MGDHWTEQAELGGGSWQFRMILAIFRFVGPKFVGLLTRPIVFFMYLGSGDRRRYSREYLDRVMEVKGRTFNSTYSVIRHFQSFASTLVDKMAAWAGILTLDNLVIDPAGEFDGLVNTLKEGRGVVALCSHLGNVEVLRALGSHSVESAQGIPDFRVLALVDFEGTGRFNEMLRSIDSDSMEDIIPVSDIGPETIIRLGEFLDSGGMIVIAGDRTTPGDGSRRIPTKFLGRTADFPYGSYLLADLLEAPVYTVFAIRENEISLAANYRYFVHEVPLRMGGSRRGREERLDRLAGFFRDKLETLTLEYPYQWFNFYKFWNSKDS